MSLSVLAIVLFAAFLHALWNALIKGAADKAAMLGLVALGHVGPGVVLVLLSEPAGLVIWPYVLASTVIHWGYYIGLDAAYRAGDLSVVYPVARGLSPVLIALGAWLLVDEALPILSWTGVILVSLGILTLALPALRGDLPLLGPLAATGVAVTIAAYSLVDGIGVRLAGSPGGYIGWLFVAEVLVFLWVLAFRRRRLLALPPRTLAIGYFGGLVSAVAYALVLYAQTLAPLGLVSALRETSVIFAALIGLFWFGEGPRAPRLLAAGIVGAGIVMIT